MFKNQKILVLITVLLSSFYSINASLIDKDSISVVDLSVYDGHESILLTWSFPDSITSNHIYVFSRGIDDLDFKLIYESNVDEKRFLDINCNPDLLSFYKINIEDIFGNVFTSDLAAPAFGSCKKIKDSLKIDELDIKLFGLNEILNLIDESHFDEKFTQLLELLKPDDVNMNIWLEKYPLDFLQNSDREIEILHSVINEDSWIDTLINKQPIISNYFKLTPDEWIEECLLIVKEIKSNWSILYSTYNAAVDFFNSIDPVKIVSVNVSNGTDKTLSLYVFDKSRLEMNDFYILSGNQFINLTNFQISDQNTISISIPNHWEKVSLMTNDSIVQECFTFIDSSLSYTLNNEIVSFDSTSLFDVSANKSPIMLNEILWNSDSRKLILELAGKTSMDTLYSIYINNEPIWKVDGFNNYDMQFVDSSFMFDENLVLPLTLSLNRFSYEKNEIMEYIILDTSAIVKSRENDFGIWSDSKILSFGASNKEIISSIDKSVIPEFFILYQNYPNPFNGVTQITFDLLEDANVSLHVTDAKGRVHEKFLENNFIYSGNYSFSWDGENKSTGIYFFTLHVMVNGQPPAVMSRKMIYLK